MAKKKYLDLYQCLLGSRRFYKFNRLLFRLGLRGMGISGRQDFEVNGEAHFLKTNANRFRTIFDVGANWGHYARQLRTFNRQASIYAFEPHPASYRKLQEIGRRLNIRTFNLAMGKQPGQAILYDYAKSSGSGHASLHQGVMAEMYQGAGKPIPVTLQTIDQFAEENRIQTIGFLKIDTEGHEYDVLAGARQMLIDNRIKVIQFEFNKMNVVSRIFFQRLPQPP